MAFLPKCIMLTAHPKGSEFQVNTYTTGVQASPAVAMDGSSGAFVIAWSSSGQDGSSSGIYAQRYLPDGTPDGTGVSGQHLHGGQPVHANRGDGRCGPFCRRLVQRRSGWQRLRHLRSAVQRGRNTGGTEFQVNTYTDGDQVSPSVAMDDAGRFVIVWTSRDQDGSVTACMLSGTKPTERLWETSSRSTPTRPLRSGNPRWPWTPVGNFVHGLGKLRPGWQRLRYLRSEIPCRRRPADATEFLVNTWTTGSQDYAALAMDAAGHFVITWRNFDQDGSGYGVFAQVFDADGSPSGTEFQVNTYTDGYQYYPAVAMNAFGRFAIAWRSDGQDGSDAGVFAKQFTGFSCRQSMPGRSSRSTHTLRTISISRPWQQTLQRATSWLPGQACRRTAAATVSMPNGIIPTALPTEASSASTHTLQTVSMTHPWRSTLQRAASWLPGQACRKTAAAMASMPNGTTPTARAMEANSA